MKPPLPQTAGAMDLDILLIEDNADDAELIRHALQAGGWTVRLDTVQTPHQFAAQMAAKAYHLVLADYRLPGWTALEALELLQQLERDIPFFIVSGGLTPEELRRCFERGIADFIAKDHLARLPAVIRAALEFKSCREECARLQRKWLEAEKRHQRLAELSPDPLLIIHGDEVLFANGAAARLLGAPNRDQLVRRTTAALFHPDVRAAMEDRLTRLTAGSEAAEFESRLVRLDGGTVDVKMAALGLIYEDRPAVQMVVADVSERKRVTETIKSLASFVQLNPDPVLELARDGKVAYANDAAGQMAQKLGLPNAAGLLPADAVQLVHMCLASGQTKQRETVIGGRTLSWAFYPITSGSREMGRQPNPQVVHCYVHDITERLGLEAQLRHAQRLESVGRLAAGVAHDFNNILTVIQGHAGLLRAEPHLSGAMQESLQQVARAAERASRLTNQLLTFSRKTVMQPRRLDLNEVLSNMSAMLQRSLGEDIEFRFAYGANIPAVLADIGMVEQVIMNLALNARDAMPRGGQVLLSTEVLDVDAGHVQRHPESRLGRFVCLTVTDTGCGMDSVTLGRIFEPFFTTKEFGKGTGLGLAVAYGIIKQHQGWIEVQSQMGQGTTFRVFLPPRPSSTEEQAGPGTSGRGAEPGRGGQETILVVEDEDAVRAVMRNVLQRYGYRVLEAANGIEALAVWHQHHRDIALLLTDMVMPVGLHGQELAEKFRLEKPHLRVVFTSGYSVETAGRGLERMEGVSFLEKPFDSVTLGNIVRAALDN